MEENEGWQTVTRRRKHTVPQRRLDIATKNWNGSNEGTCTFFFSQFPESHGAKEMMRAFSYYGDIVEVVIPPKRSGRGLRFGFARFRNVKDQRLFAVKLDNIIIGAKKLFVNIPRFQRMKHGEGGGKQQPGVKEYGQRPEKIHKVWKEVKKPILGEETEIYQHARNNEGKAWGGKPEQKVVYFRKQNLYEFCYNAPEEDLNRFKKMYVGVMKNAGSSHLVQEWFNMQGVFSVKSTPLGANLVLLEEFEEGMIVSLCTDARDWMLEKFKQVRLWSPEDADQERVVWVRCHGIPVHAWNTEFFETLAGRIGVFLGVDDNTREKNLWMWRESWSEQITMTCLTWWLMLTSMVRGFLSRCSRSGVVRCTGAG